MEIFTVEEFQEKWDELIDRVEKGEHIGIINENGQATVMIPADDELLKLYVEENNEGC
jgi:PHD/YefM family antitoxin component YafN of YafNO toxin-antitoxin module